MAPQALHPAMQAKLDPEYIAYHQQHLQHIVPSETQPWDPSSRQMPSPMRFGGLAKEPVDSVRDRDNGNYQIRAFTPKDAAPADGWPLLLWFHGGGWVMGGLDSENAFLTNVCNRVGCVVVTSNYRHAPENVYPAAVQDAVSALEWVVSPEGQEWLGIDRTLIAIGGLSAGGCLAAITSMKASQLSPAMHLRAQVLICPVIDNTATIETAWATSQHAPWLTPTRMAWYREKYFPNSGLASSWDASPCFASPELLATSPKTFLAISECDLLAPEEHKFAGQLRDAGVQVDKREYAGGTHSILVLAGVLKTGKILVEDACNALQDAFK